MTLKIQMRTVELSQFDPNTSMRPSFIADSEAQESDYVDAQTYLELYFQNMSCAIISLVVTYFKYFYLCSQLITFN